MNTLRLGFIVILGITATNSACEDDSGDPAPAPGTDAAAGAPVIESINGDGSTSTEPGAAPNRIASSLDVRGQNLSGAEVSLAAIGSSTVFQSLAVAAGSTANQLLVSLPSALTPGNYTLTVSTAMGQTSADVTLLQGEPGVCDTSECAAASGGLPGASATTVLRLQSSTAAGLEKSIIANGVELIESEVERQNDGIFALALDRTSHAIARGAVVPRSFAPSEADQLATFLENVDASMFVVFVSRGDVSTLLNAEVQIGGDDTTIGGFLVDGLGAPSSLTTNGAGDSVIVVGHTQIGSSSASHAFSSTGVVQTAVLLADDQITGANTAGGVAENAIGARELASNSVAGSNIRDGAVEEGKIAAQAVTFSRLKCYLRERAGRGVNLNVDCDTAEDVPISGGCEFGRIAEPNPGSIVSSFPTDTGWRCVFTQTPTNESRDHTANVLCCAP